MPLSLTSSPRKLIPPSAATSPPLVTRTPVPLAATWLFVIRASPPSMSMPIPAPRIEVRLPSIFTLVLLVTGEASSTQTPLLPGRPGPSRSLSSSGAVLPIVTVSVSPSGAVPTLLT
ncbi:MAG: hypothetical protein U0797_18505 [Gemmataceae bacterium]